MGKDSGINSDMDRVEDLGMIMDSGMDSCMVRDSDWD